MCGVLCGVLSGVGCALAQLRSHFGGCVEQEDAAAAVELVKPLACVPALHRPVFVVEVDHEGVVLHDLGLFAVDNVEIEVVTQLVF